MTEPPKPIKGHRINGKPGESDYETCQVCGQILDLRDLAQVMHHGLGPHEPMEFEQ